MEPAGTMEEQSGLAEGRSFVKPAQEIPSARDPDSKGNTAPTDLISIQPPPAAARPAGASQEPHNDPKTTTCPQCGLSVPDHRIPAPPPSGVRQQGSSSVHSSGRRRRNSVATSKQPASTQSDACFQLLLACLWCRCSVLLLGLLGACSSCLHALCSSCCHACARCCSAVQETPVEELNCHAHCHSVLFESCCEPTECLEFCLECCELCHRS